MPERIQLRRTKGWRKPDGAIVVARPTQWGNPWRVSAHAGGWSVDHTFGGHDDIYELKMPAVARAVILYEDAILHQANISVPSVDEIRRELRGHNLACWCPLDQPCHADVLLALANAEESG